MVLRSQVQSLFLIGILISSIMACTEIPVDTETLSDIDAIEVAQTYWNEFYDGDIEEANSNLCDRLTRGTPVGRGTQDYFTTIPNLSDYEVENITCNVTELVGLLALAELLEQHGIETISPYGFSGRFESESGDRNVICTVELSDDVTMYTGSTIRDGKFCDTTWGFVGLENPTQTPDPNATLVPTRTPLPTYTLTLAPSFTPYETPASRGRIVAPQTAHVYTTLDINAGIVATVLNNDIITLLGTSSDNMWYFVELDAGGTGWIYAEHLTVNPMFTPSLDLTALFLGTPLLFSTALPIAPLPTIEVEIDTDFASTEAAASTLDEDTKSDQEVSTAVIDIYAECDNPVAGLPQPGTLPIGTEINIVWNWLTETEDQMQNHIEAATYMLLLDDNPVLIADTIPEVDQEDDFVIATWKVPSGIVIEAGEHIITIQVSWSENVTDGFQTYGPQTNITLLEGSCTFTVD